MNKKIIIGVVAVIFIGVVAWFVMPNEPTLKGSITVITAQECLDKIENGDTFIVVVSNSTCHSCADYEKSLKEFMQDNALHVYKVIADDASNKDTFDELMNAHFPNLQFTPTTYYIVDGDIEDESVGKRDIKQIEIWVNRLSLDLTD